MTPKITSNKTSNPLLAGGVDADTHEYQDHRIEQVI